MLKSSLFVTTESFEKKRFYGLFYEVERFSADEKYLVERDSYLQPPGWRPRRYHSATETRNTVRNTRKPFTPFHLFHNKHLLRIIFTWK